MRQKTKKQLRDEISELRNELFRSIGELPDGELKKRLSSKYPDYYLISYLDKYGNDNFDWLLKTFGGMKPVYTGEFYYFESGKVEDQTKPLQ